jgi:phenylpyruvate tautomerase PptA (4-oxalocrotonate tautomerase family)
MPLYTIVTEAGTLTASGKQGLAEKLTALHHDYAGVPRNWVHVVFQDYQPGSGFTAGVPAPAVALTLLIRSGRSDDYKRGLLVQLWALVQSATAAADDQIVLSILEGPASQAMEMGRIMPDVASA